MNYEKLNKNIIKFVGGKENISAVAHCVTRLRLTLKDRSKADVEAIKNLDGVIDVVSNDVAFQVIIGTHVTDVYNEFMILTGLGETNSEGGAEKLTLRKVPTAVLAVITEAMSSIIEVLIAAGMIAGVLSLLSIIGIVSSDSPTYQIFEALKDSVFTFLPVFLAASSAKRLNVNPYIAITLAVASMSSSINGVEGLSMFGYSLPTIAYSNTFIPILLAVWLLSVVTKQLNKVVPKSIQMFFVPAVSLMIVFPIMLVAFGPIGSWIGGGLNWVFAVLADKIGYWIAIALYAAFQPFLIIFGAANFMYPISLNFFADLGYDPIFTTAATISDIAVSGAIVGYFFRARNAKEKNTFGTIGFSALMGVTEPAIFGVFLKYRRPFIAVMLGGGIGGLIAGFSGVKAMTLAWGLAGLPAFLAGGTANFVWMIIACIVSFIIAAGVSYGLGIPNEAKMEDKKIESSKGISKSQVSLGLVATGNVVELIEVSDKAFASGALGKGYGVKPSEESGNVISPVSGEVSVVFPTKHAYGIKTEEGVEVLIHIGVDTVNLKGEGFEGRVEVGQEIALGDVLATVNFDLLKSKGFDTTVIVVVTNTADFLDVIKMDEDPNNVMSVII